jgi:hypothetical protein
MGNTPSRFKGGQMPWKECSVTDERMQFVARRLAGEAMAELCREFGISRKELKTQSYIGNWKTGFLLATDTGNMLWPGTLYRDGLKAILKDMGRGKVRFHAFRRFRQAVLEKSEVRQLLIDFWLGHDNPDMSSRYAKQLTEDEEFRQEWVEKVGLCFVVSEVSDAESELSCATCATNTEEQVCTANA